MARGRGSVAEALSKIEAPALIVAITSDILFPPHGHDNLVKYIKNNQYHLIESNYGHDGFLVENEKLNGIIQNFMAQ